MHEGTVYNIITIRQIGSYKDETKELVSRFNKEHGTDVFYIDSSGWIPFEPLHPLRDGHKIIAEHLTEILKEKYSLHGGDEC